MERLAQHSHEREMEARSWRVRAELAEAAAKELNEQNKMLQEQFNRYGMPSRWWLPRS